MVMLIRSRFPRSASVTQTRHSKTVDMSCARRKGSSGWIRHWRRNNVQCRLSRLVGSGGGVSGNGVQGLNSHRSAHKPRLARPSSAHMKHARNNVLQHTTISPSARRFVLLCITGNHRDSNVCRGQKNLATSPSPLGGDEQAYSAGLETSFPSLMAAPISSASFYYYKYLRNSSPGVKQQLCTCFETAQRQLPWSPHILDQSTAC